jgi:hypothetical protein
LKKEGVSTRKKPEKERSDMSFAKQRAIVWGSLVAMPVAVLLAMAPGFVPVTFGAQSANSVVDLSGEWQRVRGVGGEGRAAWDLHPRAVALSDALDHWAYPKYDCVPATLPRIEADNYLKRYEQLPDRVVIFYEKDDVVRTVWLRGNNHPTPAVGDFTLQGHSVGWYEGDSLVVETTQFMWDPLGMTDGDPPIASSQLKKVTERYSREGGHIKVEVLTEDSLIFNTPVRATYEWEPAAREWLTYNCDPELARFPVQFQPSKYD